MLRTGVVPGRLACPAFKYSVRTLGYGGGSFPTQSYPSLFENPRSSKGQFGLLLLLLLFRGIFRVETIFKRV